LDEILIRPATEADAKPIRDLIFAVQINPMGLDWRRFMVAVAPGEEFVGCGQIKPHGDGSRELASIAVREDFRGRGVARSIIEDLLARNPPPLYLMCRSVLGPFYEKFGFRELTREDMPPYFRRMTGLAKAFELMAKDGDYLMIMKLG